jgi:hypothetical protein
VYAISTCAVENLNRYYKYENIRILSDRQPAIKEHDKHQITLKLVWNCHQSLIQLARHNRVQLIWVPHHEVIAGNGTADQLSRTVSEYPFIRPSCGISIEVSKKAVRDWTNRNYPKQWEYTTGLKEAKGPTPGPSAKRTNEDQLRLGCRTIYRILSPKRTPFQTGIDR